MKSIERLRGGRLVRSRRPRDLATHFFRNDAPSTRARCCRRSHRRDRCGVGAAPVRLLPSSKMTPVRTGSHAGRWPRGGLPGVLRAVSRHEIAGAQGSLSRGAAVATPARVCSTRSVRRARLIVIAAPSNPMLSIAPILSVPKVREALCRRDAEVIAISADRGVADGHSKGPADHLLRELSVMTRQWSRVAQLYAEIAATVVIDRADRGVLGGESCGLPRCTCWYHRDRHGRTQTCIGPRWRRCVLESANGAWIARDVPGDAAPITVHRGQRASRRWKRVTSIAELVLVPSGSCSRAMSSSSSRKRSSRRRKVPWS